MTGAVAPRQTAALTGWMTLILLLAAAFRLVGLTTVPPGMTHDEADHGITAQSIRDGARDLYFTIGYGREPLYDYVTAGVMAGGGETIFSARLTAAFFSLVMIAGTYAWARRAFGAPVALLTAAGLAVGFWSVMAGRQALRSITFPALFVLAAYWFWRGLEMAARPTRRATNVGTFPLAGVLLGLTVYTYIPARVLWLVFPAVVVYRMIATRSGQGRLWALTGLMLVIALAIAAPLLLYLNANPGLEVRVAELSAPLSAAASGDLGPLWANTLDSLKLFALEGDPTWRYNIAGRPWLGPITGVLFALGLVWAAWLAGRGLLRGERSIGRGSAAFMALVWLVGGLSPVLVTGPALSMTQAIGLLPVLYIFPAMALVDGARWVTTRWLPDDRRDLARVVAIGLVLVLVLGGAWQTARDYFGRWANEPEVRVQYESAMVAALAYIDQFGDGDVAVSTITPGPFHSPAVAALTVDNPAVTLHWFDGRESLLLPPGKSTLVIPGFTPIPDTLTSYLANASLLTTLPWQSGDLDYRTRILAVEAGEGDLMQNPDFPVSFGPTADLIGFDIALNAFTEDSGIPMGKVTAGDTVALVTGWRVHEPLPHAMLLAQLVGSAGVVAQADRLGAPGELWLPGDLLLQDLSFIVPSDTPPGVYTLITGLYTADDGRRVQTTDGADHVQLAEIEVVAP